MPWRGLVGVTVAETLKIIISLNVKSELTLIYYWKYIESTSIRKIEIFKTDGKAFAKSVVFLQ